MAREGNVGQIPAIWEFFTKLFGIEILQNLSAIKPPTYGNPGMGMPKMFFTIVFYDKCYPIQKSLVIGTHQV